MGSNIAIDDSICLIRPRAVEAPRFSALSIAPPLGLAYIVGALEAAGHTVHVIDAVGLLPGKHTRYLVGYLIGLDDEEMVQRIPEEAAQQSIDAD